MARDYKHRVQKPKKSGPQPAVSWWKWLLVILLIALFAAFLTYLSSTAPDEDGNRLSIPPEQPGKNAGSKVSPAKPVNKPSKPRFDFYTILPEAEVIVPDHEIKTRTREERVNKSKSVQYFMQAGSFRNYAEADKVKARLALMGIEAKIEKAQVGNATWNRIKIGPFSKMSSVNKIRSRLRENNIDVVVMEKSG